MGSIAILGGSAVGAASALQFARAGWQVTVIDAEFPVFERLGADPVARAGAPHTVQAHGFPSRARYELTRRVPDVVEKLADAGAEMVTAALPPFLVDGGRPGDADLDSFRSRRVTFDAVMAGVVRKEPGISVIPERAKGIELSEDSPPRATGWLLESGVVRADVLLDAAGRRSPVSGWLEDAGITQPEVIDECGLSYYGRHFRITGERPPLNNGFADVHEFPTHLQLGFLGDNDTMMLALSPHADDAALKVLRREDAFTAALEANEEFADWYAVLTPTTGVFALGSLKNRIRHLVERGRPLVVGLFQAGDSLAMTNPNRGRGVSMGLAAAGRLFDLLDANGRDPEAVAMEYDEWQHRALAVYYREAASSDLMYGKRLRAYRQGDKLPANAPAVELPEGHPISSEDIERVVDRDPDLFRTFARAMNVLDDDRQIASPAVVEKVRALLPDAPPQAEPEVRTGGLHERERMLEVLAPFS